MYRLDEELAHELLFLENNEEIVDENDNPQLLVIKTSEWAGDGKWTSKTVIFLDINTRQLYRLQAYRTGSSYNEYSYHYELQCPAVQRKERIITEEYYE